jgi:HAD superfamily hydrolase (TIGR01459 family)
VKNLQGLGEVLSSFDGLILDLWGLIHDGVRAYPDVVQTFEGLKHNGVKTILLSNAPRRSYLLIEGMTNMGIARELYDDVFSSGEATNMELVSRRDPFFKSLGNNVYHIGPDRDTSVLDGTNMQRIKSIEKADFILNTGPVMLEHDVGDYKEVLVEALESRLPMVCANPDEVVVRGGKRVICAGALARYYESLGGHVVYRGKPDPAIYRLAMDRLGIKEPDRIAVVGDSLATDVAGANAANLKSIWCTGGIHGEALGVSYGENVDPEKAKNYATSVGHMPWATISSFIL